MADEAQIKGFVDQFVNTFYFVLLKDPAKLMAMYHDQSQYSMEGGRNLGKETILAKHETLTKSEFAITTSDGHLVSENEMQILVLGQLKESGEEKAMGFTHSFLLHKIGENWAITSEIFRLTLHNF